MATADSDAESSLNVFPLSHNSSVNCLDAMRAHSPPRSAAGSHSSVDLRLDESSYIAWQKDHPSALDNFQLLAEQARGRQVAVFLDYDGTLSPIVQDPNKAFLSEEMRAVVREVASLFPTAIISGRSREKVLEFVQLSELYYAGSHGMDIKGPSRKGSSISSNVYKNGQEDRPTENDGLFLQPAADYYPIMNELYGRLKEAASSIDGALVENNKFCISVHFRRVHENDWDALAQAALNILKLYPTLHATHGRKVIEIRPAIDWDKGKALSYLLQELGLEDKESTFPLYIGDDRTDEDAFRVLRERSVGCGIIVTAINKPTKAKFSLRNPSEVMEFLQNLVDWKEGQNRGRQQGL